MKRILPIFILAITAPFCAVCAAARQPVISILSGNSVHYWGDHENAVMGDLLENMLKTALGDKAQIRRVNLENGGKVEDLAGSKAVIVFGEGEASHPLKDKMEFLKKLNDSGTGFGFFHYSLMFGENDARQVEILDSLIGGHYQTHWSVNPYFDADFKKFADHPAAGGVRPFKIYDEWHFNMKFAENSGQRITPLAVVAPPDNVRKRRFGANTGNPFVRQNLGRDETIFWLCENPNGTRGFGCTGGHGVWILANPNFARLVVNASAWLAGIGIPDGGFDFPLPKIDEIAAKIKKEKRPDYESYMEDWRNAEKSWGVGR